MDGRTDIILYRVSIDTNKNHFICETYIWNFTVIWNRGSSWAMLRGPGGWMGWWQTAESSPGTSAAVPGPSSTQTKGARSGEWATKKKNQLDKERPLPSFNNIFISLAASLSAPMSDVQKNLFPRLSLLVQTVHSAHLGPASYTIKRYRRHFPTYYT